MSRKGASARAQCVARARARALAQRLQRTFVIRGAELSLVGGRFPAAMEFKEWLETGAELCGVVRCSPWWIGAWINYGEGRWLKAGSLDEREREEAKREWGTKYKAALELTGLEYETLRHFAWVDRQVDLCRRRHNLSWSHHFEVASLESKDQEKWLALAAANGWTRSELRMQLRRANKRVVDEPKISWGFIPEKSAQDVVRGFRSEIHRLGPIEMWEPTVRTAWWKIFKPVVELLKQLEPAPRKESL